MKFGQSVVLVLFVALNFSACKGVQGPSGFDSRVATATETKGVNCKNGGEAVMVGLDTNRNAMLDIEEVTRTSYVCNGDIPGQVTLKPVPIGSSQCPEGGTLVLSGFDRDNDGEVDPEETVSTEYICQHQATLAQIITMAQLNQGSPECANGGVLITVGSDSNNDHVMDSVNQRQPICNGVDGTNGANGKDGENGLNALIRTTPIATSDDRCPDGGVLVETGIDTTSDGFLEPSEVTDSKILCAPERCQRPKAYSLDTTVLCPNDGGKAFYSTNELGAYVGDVPSIAMSSDGDLFYTTTTATSGYKVVRVIPGAKPATLSEPWKEVTISNSGGSDLVVWEDWVFASSNSTSVQATVKGNYIHRFDYTDSSLLPSATIFKGTSTTPVFNLLAIGGDGYYYLAGKGVENQGIQRVQPTADHSHVTTQVSSSVAGSAASIPGGIDDMVMDETSNTLYFLMKEVGLNKVKLRRISIATSGPPSFIFQDIVTLPTPSLPAGASGPFYEYMAIDTERFVYVSCYYRNLGIPKPCPNGSILRVNTNTKQIQAIAQTKDPALNLTFDPYLNQLTFRTIDSSGYNRFYSATILEL